MTMMLSDISWKFNMEILDEIIRKADGTKHTSFKFAEVDSSALCQLFVRGVNEEDGRQIEVNLIVKSFKDNLKRRQIIYLPEYFRNEFNFYTKVIPALERFQNARSPKNPFVEYPKCYATLCDGANDFIVLEDMSFKGFSASNGFNRNITLQECLFPLRTLARFHGLSLAFRALEPENCAAVVNSITGPQYDEDIQCAATSGSSDLDPTKPRFEVFAHGDTRQKNFLQRYKADGKVDAVALIDFSCAGYSSLIIDIKMFLNFYVSPKLRVHHFEEILRVYHESASEFIRDLGADPGVLLPWSVLYEKCRGSRKLGCILNTEVVEIADNFN